MRPIRIGRRDRLGSVAQRTEYNGRVYHSKAEARYAAQLDSLRTARGRDRVVGWVPQVPYPLEVNGRLIATYRVDFEVIYADHRVEIHEVKGRAPRPGERERDELWTIKRKLFEALYPERVLKVIRT